MGNYFGNLLGSMYLPKDTNSDWDLRNPSATMGQTDDRGKPEPSGDGSATKRAAEDNPLDPMEKTKQQKMYPSSSSAGGSTSKNDSMSSKLKPDDHPGKKCAPEPVKDSINTNDMHLDNCTLQCDDVRPKTYLPSVSSSDGICYFNELPQSIIIQIFKSIPQKELLYITSRVCKMWYELSHDQDLWRKINMHGQRHITPDALRQMVVYSDNVVSLDISDIMILDQDAVIDIFQKCPRVLELKMGGSNSLKAEAFIAIGVYCHKVQKLYLDCCFAVSDAALQSIAHGCPQLEWLNINQCMKVSDEGVEAIASCCPKLKLLCLDRCINVGDKTLLSVVKHCPLLERLSCMSCNFSVNAMESLCALKHLRELQLHDVRALSDQTVMQLVRSCPHLESLNFSLCQRITDKSVQCIASHCKKIQSLYLVDCKLTNEALNILGCQCPTLERLDVGWCQMLTDSGVENISRRSRSLKYLGLTRCDELTPPVMDKLVERFPDIHYSTVWLDCKRLLEKAGHPVTGAMLGELNDENSPDGSPHLPYLHEDSSNK